MAWTPEQAAAYAAANPDVFKAYQAGQLNNGDTNLASAMQAHYDWAGQKEGRAMPTASQEYSTQNLSPYLAAGIQNNTKAYDLNGGLINLGAGQRVTGGSLNGNVIYNADGTSAGNYYTSPEEAARARAQVQTSINSGAVAGPQTAAQQAATLQNTLRTGGITSQPSAKPDSDTFLTGGPAKLTNPGQSNILQRLAAALMNRQPGRAVDIGGGVKQWQGNSGTFGNSSLGWDPSVIGKPATMGNSLPTSSNSYYSRLAQMLTQRFGGNGITSTAQNGLLKNNSLYSNYLK